MTFIEEAVRTRILAIAAVSSVVGTHVYPDKRPQTLGGILPAIEISVPDFDPDEVLDGASGTIEARARIRVLAATMAEAESIVIAMKKPLGGTSGTWGDIPVDYALIVAEVDGWQPPSGGVDPAFFIDLDFKIGFRQ